MGTQPISFSFEPTTEGAHTSVVVRCGPAGSRAMCGKLIMRPHEWNLLRWILDTTPPLGTNEDYVPVFARDFPGNVVRQVPVDMTPIVVQPDRMGEIIGERINHLTKFGGT